MSKLKTVVLFLVISILVSFNIILAQESEAEIDSKSENYSNVFDVYFINGYALGYNLLKYPKSELRILLDLSTSYDSHNEDRKSTNTYNGVKSSEVYSLESDLSSYSINLTLQYLTKIYQTNLGEAYYGFGPFVGYTGYDNSSNDTRENIKSEYSNSNSNISIGITTLIGLRSHLTKSLSIFAEAQLSGGKSWNERENENKYIEATSTRKYSDSMDGDSWYYNFTYARLGLRFSL